jgi:hypothetical protein
MKLMSAAAIMTKDGSGPAKSTTASGCAGCSGTSCSTCH